MQRNLTANEKEKIIQKKKKMALQKEIWINDILPLLFPDNSFAARSVNHSQFVDNATVHVPNAADIEAARTSRLRTPTTGNLALEVADADLEYTIDQYFVGPYVVPRLEEVELSYNKRQSIVERMVGKINLAFYSTVLNNWLPSGFTKIATTGDAVAATAPSATGTRASMTKADVLAAKKQFDKWDIPQDGRCLLLSADMYNQLLQNLTEVESNAFLQTADASRGIVGKLYGFDIYERSTVYTTTAAGALKTGAAAATDSEAGLAWSEYAVSRAAGVPNVYGNYSDAAEFGDVISVDIRGGGSAIRSDGKGVLMIYQATV
jgi:hypothetical protein